MSFSKAFYEYILSYYQFYHTTATGSEEALYELYRPMNNDDKARVLGQDPVREDIHLCEIVFVRPDSTIAYELCKTFLDGIKALSPDAISDYRLSRVEYADPFGSLLDKGNIYEMTGYLTMRWTYIGQ